VGEVFKLPYILAMTCCDHAGVMAGQTALNGPSYAVLVKTAHQCQSVAWTP